MAYLESSELHLLEVSRRVRKLTQMIDSWSKAPNLDARSKYIAKDLLRGSLDLQESLIMIGRLQEASRMMSMKEQIHNYGFIKERKVEEGNGDEGYGSQRVGVGLYDDILRNLSTNCSSRNHVNEIKSAISGNLSRKKVESIFTNVGKAPSSRFIEFPTRDNFGSMEKSKGTTVPTVGAETPNLIAKLMGLEKIPLELVQPIKKEQKNDELINISTKIIITEEYKVSTGSIAKPFVGGSDDPPIVIMKPLYVGHENQEERLKKKEILSARLSRRREFSDYGKILNMKLISRTDKHAVESSHRFRTLDSTAHKQQRKEPMTMGVKKVNILNSKVPKEKNNVKAISAPTSPVKRIRESPAKSDKSFCAPQVRGLAFCVQSNSPRKHITATFAETLPKHRAISVEDGDKKKGEKLARKSTIKTATTKCKGVGKRINPTNKITNLSSNFSTAPIRRCPQELGDYTNHCCRENTRSGPKSFCEIMPKISKGDNNRISVVTVEPPYDQETEAAGSGKNVKLLLLSSSAFLTEAAELFGFDVHMHQAMCHKRNKLDEIKTTNGYELLLGCAGELMAKKSYQLKKLFNHPMWATYQRSRKVQISLERLVEDISEGIKKLNNYHSVSGSEDGLYLRLERDLRCKDMPLNASWDIGWINWVCVEEVDVVVEVVEEQIFCGLVGEVTVDLVN